VKNLAHSRGYDIVDRMIFLFQEDILNQLINIIICIFLPPLAVLLKFGLGKDFLINLILSIFFWVPGIIHALWVTTR